MKSETMDILQNKYGYPAAYHAELFTNNKGGVKTAEGCWARCEGQNYPDLPHSVIVGQQHPNTT